MTGGKRLTPKQKRAIRKKAHLEKNASKTARLLSLPEYTLVPRIQDDVPEPTKTPRALEDPGSIMNLRMEWRKRNADTRGSWSWGQNRQWSSPEWEQEIYPKLVEFERLTWRRFLRSAQEEKSDAANLIMTWRSVY